MKKKVIIIGSGGHAKVVIDILNLMEDVEILGVTSKSLLKKTTFCNFPVLGDDSILSDYRNHLNIYVAMGLGGFTDNKLREKAYKYTKSLGLSFINIIHPSSTISKTVTMGEGVVIFSGVVLNTEVAIGNNVIIATGSTIDHETIIKDHVLISAGVTIGAYSTIEGGALIALGSKIVSGIIVGADSLVAAGAVVVNNIEPGQRVFGIPARPKMIF